jgi:dTDP-4-amino-4,6-dideoxygalactose transaminase
MKLLRGHGARPKYHHQVVGGNFRLDALQAAVLRVKLRYLDEWTAARQRNADHYRRLFTEAGLVTDNRQLKTDNAQSSVVSRQSFVILPHAAGYGRHIYNQFVIRLAQRDSRMAHLKRYQIGHEVYYPAPRHLQERFANLGYRAGDFPASEPAARETLALPIYPELTEALQAAVVNAVATFAGGALAP